MALFLFWVDLRVAEWSKTHGHRKKCDGTKNPGYILSSAKKYKRGGVKNPLTASKEKLHLQTHGGLLVAANPVVEGKRQVPIQRHGELTPINQSLSLL